MNLQSRVELFISKAHLIQFAKESKSKAVMCLYYVGEGFKDFKNNSNYDDLYEYFKDRKVLLSITVYNDKIVISIVDKNNGDSLNISKVNFETTNFQQFLQTTPKSNTIKLIVTGLSPDGETKVIPQKMLENGPIEIQGYRYKNNQQSE